MRPIVIMISALGYQVPLMYSFATDYKTFTKILLPQLANRYCSPPPVLVLEYGTLILNVGWITFDFDWQVLVLLRYPTEFTDLITNSHLRTGWQQPRSPIYVQEPVFMNLRVEHLLWRGSPLRVIRKLSALRADKYAQTNTCYCSVSKSYVCPSVHDACHWRSRIGSGFQGLIRVYRNCLMVFVSFNPLISSITSPIAHLNIYLRTLDVKTSSSHIALDTSRHAKMPLPLLAGSHSAACEFVHRLTSWLLHYNCDDVMP